MIQHCYSNRFKFDFKIKSQSILRRFKHEPCCGSTIRDSKVHYPVLRMDLEFGDVSKRCVTTPIPSANMRPGGDKAGVTKGGVQCHRFQYMDCSRMLQYQVRDEVEFLVAPAPVSSGHYSQVPALTVLTVLGVPHLPHCHCWLSFTFSLLTPNNTFSHGSILAELTFPMQTPDNSCCQL